MRSARSILILSLGANVLLAGWLAAKVTRRPTGPAAPAASEVARRPGPVVSAARVLRTNVLEVTTNVVDAPGFRWTQIETNDFRAYAANLRALGCPEKTLRAILLPDIEQAFTRRKRDLSKAPEPFWRNAAQVAARDRELDRARMALDAERKALTRELVGVEWSYSTQTVWVDEEDVFFPLGFLTDDKALSVIGLGDRIEQVHDAVRHETRGVIDEQDEEHLRAVARVVQGEAMANLTPTEAEELTLRGFDVMQTEVLGERHLRGIGLNGVEYRELLRLATQGRDWLSDVLLAAVRDEVDQDAMEKIAQQRPEQFDTQARALLGDQRFTAYQVMQDREFRNLMDMADNAHLPESVAFQAYNVRQTALAEGQRLAADATLPPEQCQAALSAMHQATEQALVALYGQKQGSEIAKRIEREVIQNSRKGRQ